MGWRYQIPLLVDMGCRVVAPDMMGYGGTVPKLHSGNYVTRLISEIGCTKSPAKLDQPLWPQESFR
jgi:hypothetical protein